jgi:hypothetical protein
MKLRLFANATLLGLLLMPLANAQLSLGVQGKIPFEFRIGDQTLPAGEYKFVQHNAGSSQLILMRNLDYKSTPTMFISSSVEAKASVSSEPPRLVFHRYGTTYFLSQLWEGFGERSGTQLQRSKAEQTVAHQMAGLRKADIVEVALNSSHRGMKATD